MQNTVQPHVEAMQFGGYLLSERLISQAQLQEAFEELHHRPFLHIGEILCLTGAISERLLAKAQANYHREARLGSILLAKGLLNLRQLAGALELQISDPRPIGEILVRMGVLDPETLEHALAEQRAINSVSRDLFDKCHDFRYFREAQAKDTYPFFHAVQTGESARTRVNDREVVMLAANSYLGMSTDPATIEASIETTRRYGVGTSGSPLLNGTMDLHVALERELAEFMGKEACAIYSTGFQTNLGVISGLVGSGDVVLADSFAHASIHDGCRLGFGEFKRFSHNNMAHLEQLLKQAGNRGKLVVIDGVYSMDGDIADLPQIVRLAKSYGAKVLVDDAHGFGVLGRGGRGTAEYYGMTAEVDLIMLTFSKSLGTIGGCILGDEAVIHYLKHRSRPYVFSASLPPGTVGATHAALQRIKTDPSLRQRLADNVEYLKNGFIRLGFNLGLSHTQILPVLIGDEQLALQMGSDLLKEGVMVATVVPPGVSEGEARLRVSVMATHTKEDLDFALKVFERIGKRLNVIGSTSTYPEKGEKMFQIELVESPDVLTLMLTGELDTSAAAEMDSKLEQLAMQISQDVAVELTHLSYMNSTGIRSFLRLDKLVKANGKKLVIKALTEDLYKLFYYCGLDTYFNFESPDISQFALTTLDELT